MTSAVYSNTSVFYRHIYIIYIIFLSSVTSFNIFHVFFDPPIHNNKEIELRCPLLDE